MYILKNLASLTILIIFLIGISNIISPVLEYNPLEDKKQTKPLLIPQSHILYTAQIIAGV